MDIISIDKTIMTKESKHTKTKAFVFVVALKRAVLNGSTKSCFKISYDRCERLLRFQRIYFWNDNKVSLHARIVNFFVFSLQFECV